MACMLERRYNCHTTSHKQQTTYQLQQATCNKRLLELPENTPAATKMRIYTNAELSVSGHDMGAIWNEVAC
jgi:hypothetical protein